MTKKLIYTDLYFTLENKKVNSLEYIMVSN